MTDLGADPFEVRRLTGAEGGGYLVTFPDFTECIADGSTIEEAVSAGQLALAAVIATLEAYGRPIPEPGRGMRPRELPAPAEPAGEHEQILNQCLISKHAAEDR